MAVSNVTRRQKQVLDLLLRGRTNAQIAEELGISLEGAKWHVREVLEVTGAGSREEAAEIWRTENGLPRRFARMTWGIAAAAGLLGVAAVLAAVVFVLVSRGDEGKDLTAPTPDPAPSATPTSTSQATATQAVSPTVVATRTPRPLQQPSRATGNPPLDDLISHVEAGQNWDRSLIGTFAVPCKIEVYIVYPECPPGAPEDTPVDSVFLFRCEAKWVDPDRVTELGDRTTQLVLESVVEGGRSYTRVPVPDQAPDYWLLFRGGGTPGSSGFAMAVDDGKVWSWGDACGTFESLEESITAGSTGYLVPPP